MGQRRHSVCSNPDVLVKRGRSQQGKVLWKVIELPGSLQAAKDHRRANAQVDAWVVLDPL